MASSSEEKLVTEKRNMNGSCELSEHNMDDVMTFTACTPPPYHFRMEWKKRITMRPDARSTASQRLILSSEVEP